MESRMLEDIKISDDVGMTYYKSKKVAVVSSRD
jgi:hypothetical protein